MILSRFARSSDSLCASFGFSLAQDAHQSIMNSLSLFPGVGQPKSNTCIIKRIRSMKRLGNVQWISDENAAVACSTLSLSPVIFTVPPPPQRTTAHRASLDLHLVLHPALGWIWQQILISLRTTHAVCNFAARQFILRRATDVEHGQLCRDCS
jgi:hypothetical protein